MKHKDVRAKLKALREMSADKVGEELLSLRREQFNLRMQAATGQGARPDQHGSVRRSIARLKTVQGERARAERAGAPGPAAPTAAPEAPAAAAPATTVAAPVAKKTRRAKAK
jgi:large subunit ribosomal protein L29